MTNIGERAVPALMRDGVVAFARVAGLSEAVLRLSGKTAQSVKTRDGLKEALDVIRSRYPTPQNTLLRLTISTSTPKKATEFLGQIRQICDRDPDAGLIRFDWKSGKDRHIVPFHWISGGGGVQGVERMAWDCVSDICIVTQTHPRQIKNPSQLAALARRSLKKLKGSSRKAAEAVAATPRVFAIDPDAAAIAYAHAPRERGAVAVTILNATEGTIWRASATTRVRPVSPRPWHRDPDVAKVMLDTAQTAIARCAPRQIAAQEGGGWVQAILIQTIDGFDAYIQKQSGMIDYVAVSGRGTWASLGAETAVRLASILGQPVVGREGSWLPFESVTDVDQYGIGPSLKELAAAGRVSEVEMTRFRFRVAAAIERSRDAAILAFYAGLPPVVSRLARLIMPIASWDPASARKYGLDRCHLDAAVAAATHSDPMSMARAVENSSTSSLMLAAALCGPWHAASDALASGDPPARALSLFASALIGRPVPPAVVSSLAGWPLWPSGGFRNSGAYLAEFRDGTMLAASLWAAKPSRPAMTTQELLALIDGLRNFGFVAPSVAGHYDRTWDDPATTTAYSEALRWVRSDVPGSAVLGTAVYDMIHFLDKSLSALGLAHDAREAVRKAILVPSGRLAQGLERMATEWHRSVVRSTRERHALVGQLISEQVLEDGCSVSQDRPECFPNPVRSQLIVGDITIQALRTSKDIELESLEMANCISTFCDEAREGKLLLYRLSSPLGRSTLGLLATGSEYACQIDIYQHYGPQHYVVDAPPPPGHIDAAHELITSLMKRNGGCGGPNWRKKYFAVRRSYARAMASRPSEQILSPARQRQLAELGLKHLGCLMGRHERELDLDQFQQWAGSLVNGSCSRFGPGRNPSPKSDADQ